VLIHSGLKPGASSRPPLTEEASSPGDRLTSRPAHRRPAAAAAAVTAATASATTEPAGASGGGSASSAHSHTVNSPRTAPAREANRASQSRTVDAGVPRPDAIGRYPSPPASPASAAQITATPSARRSRQLTGSSTCVPPQPPHRDRRGRSRQPIPPPPRITRSRACPHPARTPEHAGQRNRPAASRRSTSRASAPTVTIGASAHLARPSRHLGQEKDGRAAAYPDLITVASHTKKDNPAGLPSRPSSPQTTSARRYVLIPRVAGHPGPHADLVLRWKGGATSELTVPLRRRQPKIRTDEDTIDLIRRLAVHYPDAKIAGILNRQQRRTARGLSYTASRVQSLRYHWKIPCHQPSGQAPEGELLNVTAAARQLGIAPSTLLRWLDDGFVAGEQVTPGAPWRIRLTDQLRGMLTDTTPDGWVPLGYATQALGVSRQTVLQKVKRGELRAVLTRTGRRKGLRIEVPPPQDGLF
jgi:hypothetical protein